MAVKNKNLPRSNSINGVIIHEMFGFELFGSHIGDLLSMILSDIDKKQKIWVATVNPEFVMESYRDKGFFEILKCKTTHNVIDGIGLIWAVKVLEVDGFVNRLIRAFFTGVKILCGELRENLIMGADLMDDLCALAQKNEQSVYFYGGWNNRAEKTAKYFKNKYPALKIVGARAENFDFETKVDYLFVARAMKKQELWIEENFDKLKCKLVMGVGRSFDYYSGELIRAPVWIRKVGFEWLFSLIVEPKRWKRQLALPRFIWMVLTKKK